VGTQHVLITPHTASETCRHEDNVFAIMQKNLTRLSCSDGLLNLVV
jgi:hypothetical protein